MSIGDILKLQLDSIASGGDAIGKFEGKTVFVEGGAPEELVTCRITEDRDTWARGELLEVIESSPVRVKPACAFYNKCGGCNLQHIDYNAQLKIKENILKDSLLRIGGIKLFQIEVFSSPPFEYRNRMQFHCLRELAKNSDKRKYGLKGRKSSEIAAVTDCPVAVSEIREKIKSSSFVLPVEKDRFTVFSKDSVLLSEGGQQRGKIKILDKEITVDAGMFFQSNCVMLEKLILQLREIAENAADTAGADNNIAMADLYCGVGTYALFLSDLFPKIILAEENKNAVSLARENLKGINAEYFALRDIDWQKTLFKEQITKNKEQRNNELGFAVIDPPRAGLAGKLALTLAQSGIPVIAYVSCDPASLARDAKILVNGGYDLKSLKLFDFYPQTSHIESLAVFER
ncbi:MAG: TRAM domain-containing protein [Treponema sp.]|nr:TRAM domain-containing protein [Treponema sp.]